MDVARALMTALVGVYLLSCAVQGWFQRNPAATVVRLLLLVAAMMMIAGGLATDLGGVALAVVAFLLQKKRVSPGLAARV